MSVFTDCMIIYAANLTESAKKLTELTGKFKNAGQKINIKNKLNFYMLPLNNWKMTLKQFHNIKKYLQIITNH